MKKQSDLQKLMEYAGSYKILTFMSWILSIISALMALVPFIYIWEIIRAVLLAAPDYGNAQNLGHYGWMAVILSVLSMLIYLCGLLCSHFAAFRVQASIRSKALHHIVKLPMGFMDEIGSGKIRKTVDECSAATETYLAHQLPDQAGAIATPIGLIVMLLIFDWRLGILSLIPVVVSFLVMSAMTGQKMKDKMKEYQNSLDSMSNEAVEYVRGIPVVKTFGQSVFSFKRFKAAIGDYEKWVISYTKDLRLPMMFYTTAVNAVFAVLIAAGIVFTANGVTDTFLLNLLFYIIITPIITVTLTKLMYASENKMIVADAIGRIEEIFEIRPLSETESPRTPFDNSVSFDNASFRYPGAKVNALYNIDLDIKPGEHVAFVGASGGGKTTLASLIARFFDVNSGEVRIGNADVRSISKEVLMNTVSFVFQDSKLLKMSIFENVRIGKPDADRKEVLRALHDAQCDILLKSFRMVLIRLLVQRGYIFQAASSK